LLRNILADKPRVTKFPIEWDAAKEAPAAGGEVEMQQGEQLTPPGAQEAFGMQVD